MDWANADISEIAAALAAAQGEFGPVVKRLTAEVAGKGKAGGEYKYRYSYADLAEVNNAVMTALSKNGIALMQPAKILSATPRYTGDISCIVQVQTILMHNSGQVIAFDPFELRSESQGPQAVGSTLTYARRYSLQACLGIAPEFDDDGAAGQGSQPGGAGSRNGGDRRPTPRQDRRRQQQPQQQANGQGQQAQDQRPQQPKKSEQYDRLLGHIRNWVTQYPQLFPDAKAVWTVMRPSCERLGLSSANLPSCTDVAAFREITQPVLDAIAEYKQQSQQQSTSNVEGTI